MDVINETYQGNHFAINTNIECHTPEVNML